MKQQNFWKNLSDSIKRDIRTTIPAKVISFNESKMVADVQPLFLMIPDEGQTPVKMGMLQDVPIQEFRFKFSENVNGVESEVVKTFKPIYKAGDVVILNIFDRNIDNLQKEPFVPNSRRMFNPNDAIITGGWQL